MVIRKKTRAGGKPDPPPLSPQHQAVGGDGSPADATTVPSSLPDYFDLDEHERRKHQKRIQQSQVWITRHMYCLGVCAVLVMLALLGRGRGQQHEDYDNHHFRRHAVRKSAHYNHDPISDTVEAVAKYAGEGAEQVENLADLGSEVIRNIWGKNSANSERDDSNSRDDEHDDKNGGEASHSSSNDEEEGSKDHDKDKVEDKDYGSADGDEVSGEGEYRVADGQRESVNKALARDESLDEEEDSDEEPLVEEKEGDEGNSGEDSKEEDEEENGANGQHHEELEEEA